MKKIIIIGAGIAGLTAAVYARKNGFEVEVYEMHTIPGGECTGWNREGYHFDNCIHWLTGTKEGTELYELWKTVGALDGVETYTAKEYAVVKTDETEVHLYQDIDRLRKHLKEISKEDSEAIDKYCDTLLKIQALEMPIFKPMDQMNLLDYIKLGIKMKEIGMVMQKLSKRYIEDYVSDFKHPAIRRAISMDMSNVGAYGPLFSMGTFSAGNGGWPMGGSLAMALRMEKRAKDLGCKFYYKQKVNRILVEQGTAIGIELADGKIIKGDYIVPCNDLYVTMYQFLEGKYSDSKIDEIYNHPERYQGQTSISVGIGVSCDLSHRPANYSVIIPPFECAGARIESIAFKHFANEKSFAPEGHSVLTTQISAEYDTWKALKDKDNDYEAAKVELEKNIRRTLENIYPETKGHIEVVTIATPVTYERYCGAHKGNWMSFIGSPAVKNFQHNGIIKHLSNLYIAGQWLWSPGGLPVAAATGKWAIQRICKKEKKVFES